jgi:hypothetical protein
MAQSYRIHAIALQASAALQSGVRISTIKRAACHALLAQVSEHQKGVPFAKSLLIAV